VARLRAEASAPAAGSKTVWFRRELAAQKVLLRASTTTWYGQRRAFRQCYSDTRHLLAGSALTTNLGYRYGHLHFAKSGSGQTVSTLRKIGIGNRFITVKKPIRIASGFSMERCGMDSQFHPLKSITTLTRLALA